jgi:hypothetical protein
MNKLTCCLSTLLLATVASAQEPIFLLDRYAEFDTTGLDTRAIAPADFDGDGRVDIVVANYAAPNELYRHYKNRLKAYPSEAINAGESLSMDAAWVDFDDDGNIDLSVANGNDTPNQLFRNQGGGTNKVTFMAVTDGVAVTVGRATQALAWGDVDGDGDLDLLTANKRQPNGLFLNDGAGGLTEDSRSFIAKGNDSSRDVVVGDLDGDGDLDVVFANSNDEANLIHINQGGHQGGVLGEFHKPSIKDAACRDKAPSFGVSLADIEGDGDLDLFVANRQNAGNVLYRNDGLGHFTVADDQGPSHDAGDSFRGAWTDLNADGLPDLFVVNRLQPGLMYINGPDGLVRQDLGAIAKHPSNSRDAAFAIIGKDTLPDLLVANSIGEQSLVYENFERYRRTTILVRPAQAVDPDATGSFQIEARPLLPRHRVKAKVENVDLDRTLTLFVEDPPESGLFMSSYDLVAKKTRMQLRVDTLKGQELPLDLDIREFLGRRVEIRDPDGAPLLTGVVGGTDAKDQKQQGRSYLVRTGDAPDSHALAQVRASSLPYKNLEELSLSVTTARTDLVHTVSVGLEGGAMEVLGELERHGKKLTLKTNLFGGPGADTVAALAGHRIEVTAGGQVVLTGPVPEFAPLGTKRGNSALEPAAGATGKLKGWAYIHSIASQGDERFGLNIRGKGVGDRGLVLYMETAARDGTLELLGPLRTKKPSYVWFQSLRKRGEALPFGEDKVDELAGRLIEVRDPDGVVQLHGTVPELN